MLFLISAALFAAVVLSFSFLMGYSRSHGARFSGDVFPMAVSVLYTGAFAGSLFLLCGGAIRLVPNILVGLFIGIATAAAIVVTVIYFMRRPDRLPGTIAPAR